MGGAVAARAVAPVGERIIADGWVFEAARPEDDVALRAMLRQNPMPGWVSLSYEREPNYFLAATTEGDVHQTILAREETTGRVLGLFTRSEYDAFVNGRVARLGYLGQLRVDPAYQGKVRRLRQGYEACRVLLHETGGAPFYLTSILAANKRARRLLLARLPGLPIYDELGLFVTLVLPTAQFSLRAGHSSVEVRRATVLDVSPIADLLQRVYRRYQCAQVWTQASLLSPDRCRGLRMDDFFVAERAGRLIACAALWDQGSFKQYVVRGYDPRVRRWRGVLNAVAPCTGLPRLPKIGEPLRLAYVSHLAVAQDEPDVFMALLKAVGAGARKRGHELLALGFAEKHPLLPAARRRFRQIQYQSLLCLVYWNDSKAAVAALEDRPIHVELAML